MCEGEVLEAGQAGQRPRAQRHDLVVGEVQRGEGAETCSTQPVIKILHRYFRNTISMALSW